jgi:hypothetical protein
MKEQGPKTKKKKNERRRDSGRFSFTKKRKGDKERYRGREKVLLSFLQQRLFKTFS